MRPCTAPRPLCCQWDVATIQEAARSKSDLTGGGPYLSEAQMSALAREASFKFTQLQSWALYREYYNKTAIPQGCMYLYTQGHDSAPRDLHQMVPILSRCGAKQLATETLELTMMVRTAVEGNPSYGWTSYGCAGDECQEAGAGLVGGNPDFAEDVRSDLDPYFLWAVLAYVEGLEDGSGIEWLTSQEEVDFYPRGSPTPPPGATGFTVLDHIKAAWTHLVSEDGIGLGPHGLLKLRNGDWDDGIVQVGLSLRGNQLTEEIGESIPVTFKTLSVAPQVATLLETAFPDNDEALTLASNIRGFVDTLAATLKTSMNDPEHPLLVRRTNEDGVEEAWFARAWIYGRLQSDLPWQEAELYGSEHPDLYAQVWALQNENLLDLGVFTVEDVELILETLHRSLDETSAIGATCWRPDVEDNIGGQLMKISWSSIRNLLYRAYFTHAVRVGLDTETGAKWEERAWVGLYKTSFDNWSQLYPDKWMGVLSGPDAFNSTSGGAWYIPQYGGMDDFPFANSHPSSDWLLTLHTLLNHKAEN